MVLKISPLATAIGKKLETVNYGIITDRLLLGFEDGVYCQLNVDKGYERGDETLEEDFKFLWQDYSRNDLVKEGILTAEWVAEQVEQEKKARVTETEKRERDMLALLKQKYEGQQ